IRRKARRLARLPAFSDRGPEDLEQELTLALLRRKAAFDPARGTPRAFAGTVVSRAAANLLRRHPPQNRDPRRETPRPALPATRDEGLRPLAQGLGQDAHDRRLGRQARGGEGPRDLAWDVAELLARLPPDERDLAERLKGGGLSDAARQLGVP